MVYFKLFFATLVFTAIFFGLDEKLARFFSVFGSFTITAIIVSWFMSNKITRVILQYFPVVDPNKCAVLITGCDSGFGQLTALRANKLGFFVFAGCLNPETSRLQLMSLSHDPSKMMVLELDVTKPEHVDNCFDIVKETLKGSHENSTELKLHGLVNCAGIMTWAGIEFGVKGSIDEYQKLMDVNCFGSIRVTKTFLSLIRESRGRIVIVSSIMSRIVSPATNAYSVSKAALSAFIEGLRIEVDPFGVKVTGIEPWLAKTNMITGDLLPKSYESQWNATPKNIQEVHRGFCYPQFLRFNTFFSEFPLDVTPDQVVSKIMEGILSREPPSVVQVINTVLGRLMWLVNEVFPYDITIFGRVWMFRIIYYLLSFDVIYNLVKTSHFLKVD